MANASGAWPSVISVTISRLSKYSVSGCSPAIAVGTISPRSLYASTSNVAGFAALVSSGPGFFTQGGSDGGLNARFEGGGAERVGAHFAVHEQRKPRRAAQARLPGGLHRLRHSRAQVRRRVVGAEARAEGADVDHREADLRPVERRPGFPALQILR